jgi:D-2-hydroxyacid dehydrogenase (NADP+)
MLRSPTILFGHFAYRLADAWQSRAAEQAAEIVEARTIDGVEEKIATADVLVVSRFWRNDWIEKAQRLSFIQAVSAGTEQFDLERLRQKGVRLASAQGANANAVAEHALGLMLSLSRRLALARDHQRARHWRGIMADLSRREIELAGSTLVVIGLGQIGLRIASFGKALDMRVIGVRRVSADPSGSLDAVLGVERLQEALREADVVIVACPHTPETEGLIDADAFKAMKPTAFLINVARGRVVDEDAMVEALREKRLAGVGLDCLRDEPLPSSSPLWDFDNAVITSHNGGDTQHYEARVIDLLVQNLERLSRGETRLLNQVI